METRIYPSHNSENSIDSQEEFTLVERVARIVSRVRGTNPDYTRLAFELEQTIPFDIFGVVLLRHDGKAVRVTVCQRAEHPASESVWVASYHQHPFAGSMLEQMVLQPKLRVEDTIEEDGGIPAISGDALSAYPQLCSTLIVPLVVGHRAARERPRDAVPGDGRVLGTLEFGSHRACTYNNLKLQRLVEAVADVLATAIERVQLGGSAEIQNRQRQALKDVSSALTAEVELSTILEQIVVGIEQALNVASAMLLLDPHEGVLRLEAQAGLDEAVGTQIFGKGVPVSEQCVLGYSLVHRQPALSSDIATDEQFPYNRILAQSHGIRSIYSYPLMAGTTIYGLLVLFSPEVDAFTPLKMDIFSLFASQASIAIHNGMLLESARQRSRFQEAIEQQEAAVNPPVLQTRKRPLGDTLALLTRTAEAALVRAGTLGELGGLLLQLRQSTNSVKDAWFVIDLDGICIYMNPAAEALCGVRVETVSDLPLEQVFSGLLPRMRNEEEVYRYLQEFIPGSGYQQEIRCILATEPIKFSAVALELEQKARQSTPDAKKNSLRLESAPSDYHYHLVRYPLHNTNGQLVGCALQMLDVTEQVHDEKNRSAFLSSVSHDLRTPLTTIKAAVSGLLQPGAPWSEEEIHDMLEDIDSEADHLTVLVSALVELSRIEMGALHLEKEWCDIVEIIHGGVKKAERVLAGRPVRVQAQSPLPLVHVDHVQMERVIFNLLENATRHASVKTELLIEVDLQEQQVALPTEVQLVRVKVTDRGSGVSVYERERIFKSFYGVRSSSNGLGLAICKGIIEAHHGHIWVEGPAKALSRSKGNAEQAVLQEEEDIVTRVTKKLEQRQVQEGVCFIFTLPTYPARRLHVKELLQVQEDEKRSSSKPLVHMSREKDSVLEGSSVEFASEELG